MKVLLFGGNGFLGKALKVLLDNSGIECSSVSRKLDKSDYTVDISDFEGFNCLPLNYFNVVVNCASTLPGLDYLDSDYLKTIYQTNILGSQNICKWIDQQNSIQKVVNCSTLAVVKKPWNTPLTEENAQTYPYGKHVLYSSSKLTQELLFKTFSEIKNIKLTQIRFSSLYGETMKWSGLIPNLIDQARNSNQIITTNGSKVTVDFLHVTDAAKIILAVIKSELTGIFNGASGHETSILELVDIIKKNMKHYVENQNTEDGSPLFDRASVSVKRLNKIIDVSTFVSLDEGIKKMIE